MVREPTRHAPGPGFESQRWCYHSHLMVRTISPYELDSRSLQEKCLECKLFSPIKMEKSITWILVTNAPRWVMSLKTAIYFFFLKHLISIVRCEKLCLCSSKLSIIETKQKLLVLTASHRPPGVVAGYSHVLLTGAQPEILFGGGKFRVYL